MTMSDSPWFIYALNWGAHEAHRISTQHGFWEEGVETRNKGELIALMHSELSEALEAIRKGNPPDDKLPQYAADGVELGDAIIRIFDYCVAYDIPIGEIVAAKMDFNEGRPHKHGKKF